jgi:hypothetical protein
MIKQFVPVRFTATMPCDGRHQDCRATRHHALLDRDRDIHCSSSRLTCRMTAKPQRTQRRMVMEKNPALRCVPLRPLRLRRAQPNRLCGEVLAVPFLAAPGRFTATMLCDGRHEDCRARPLSCCVRPRPTCDILVSAPGSIPVLPISFGDFMVFLALLFFRGAAG